MKLVVLLLLTLAVFSENDHTEQGTIEKNYCFTLPSDYDKNPSDLKRDFQVHCDTDEGTSIEFGEHECIKILNDGKPNGYSSENQCIFTLLIDPVCMDEYLDKTKETEDTGAVTSHGNLKGRDSNAKIDFTICFNNIRKPAPEELNDQP